MGFNPLTEKGTPIEQQTRTWSQLNVKPYDKSTVHPYTRTRVIAMNGIEVEGVIFSHQFARNWDDPEIKRHLAMTRRIEQQQQKEVNWLIPSNESTLEVTIGYEQVAVDLTAQVAQKEPDEYVKAAFDFGLLEDFDHLYRYANLMEATEGKRAEAIVRDLTEITPGRPTIAEHVHPFDTVRNHYDARKADILTKLHILTVTAAEQQTMNYYMTVGNRLGNALGRALYQEIAQIEEQHVSHYESLADPRASWFEKLVLHEYNECYMYYSCMTSETDERIRSIWQMGLECEIEHLRIARELMKKHEKRDAADELPDKFPELTVFQSNKAYVRKILGTQLDFTANETKFVPLADHPARYPDFQYAVNGDGWVPSQEVVEEAIRREGSDYRLETEGPHPVERMRGRKMVTV